MNCAIIENKSKYANIIIRHSIEKIRNKEKEKMNLIWLEAFGCSGNIISLCNADDPDLMYLLTEMVNMKFNNSLMAKEGEFAFEMFLETLETEFILVVEGAVSLKSNGLYNTVARYQNRLITGKEAVALAGEKAKYVIAAGTCASYGGISGAKPNPGECISVPDFLPKSVIRLPGCPSHPQWVIGTIAHLLAFGIPPLDNENRPLLFYGVTIHDLCPRRSYFDKGVFAKKLGDKECLFKLGCKGPVTKTDCPIRRWNNSENWPVGDNSPCIGCASNGFPDRMEPFIKYEEEI